MVTYGVRACASHQHLFCTLQPAGYKKLCAPVRRKVQQLWMTSPTTRPAIVVPKSVYADKHRVVTSSCGTFSCSRIYPSNAADLCQSLISRLATAVIRSSLHDTLTLDILAHQLRHLGHPVQAIIQIAQHGLQR